MWFGCGREEVERYAGWRCGGKGGLNCDGRGESDELVELVGLGKEDEDEDVDDAGEEGAGAKGDGCDSNWSC